MNIKSIGLSLVLSILLTPIVSAKDNVGNNAEHILKNGVENNVEKNSANVLVDMSTSVVPPDTNVDSKSPPDNSYSTASLLASLKDSQPVTTTAVSDGAIGKMFFGLAGVLILIFACSWMLKRFNINKFGMTNSLSVSGVLPIGAKEKVVVVDIEGTRLVLGVTTTNITKLHTLDAADEQSPPMKEEKKSPISSDFSEKMKKIMKEGLKSD